VEQAGGAELKQPTLTNLHNQRPTWRTKSQLVTTIIDIRNRVFVSHDLPVAGENRPTLWLQGLVSAVGRVGLCGGRRQHKTPAGYDQDHGNPGDAVYNGLCLGRILIFFDWEVILVANSNTTRRRAKSSRIVHIDQSGVILTRSELKRPSGQQKSSQVKQEPRPEIARPPAAPSPDTPGNVLVTCPQCKVQVTEKRLEKHMRERCPKRYSVARSPQQTQVQSVHKHSQVANRRLVSSSPGTSPSQRSQNEALNQSDSETRFADKYVGQMRREGDGKFGSLPLYDDYGDEANAD